MSIILWETIDDSNGHATWIFRVEDGSRFLRNVGNNPEDDLYIFTVILTSKTFLHLLMRVFCLMAVVKIKENWIGVDRDSSVGIATR